MNLIHQLEERATMHPDRTALIDKNRVISYSKLYQEVANGAHFLKSNGLQKGDCILIIEPISIDLYIHLLSAFHAGMTVMLIDPSVGKKVIQHNLTLHQVDGFIGSPKAHLLRLIIPKIRQIHHIFHTTKWMPLSKKWNTNTSGQDLPQPTQVNKDTPALITFTSGSTGMPKAACRTHGFLTAQHTALSSALAFEEGAVDLITLPVFAIANLASGMTSVIANTDLRVPAQADSAAIREQCLTHNITRCAASPAFFQKLHQDHCLDELKTIYTGGAPVFPHLLDNIQRNHPELGIITVYGSTEAEPISHIAWNEITEKDHQAMKNGKGLLVGEPVPETKVMIHQPAEDGIGQITVTGEHVLKGYLNGIGDDETKISHKGDIWHLTGDMGYLDTMGRLWLMGRESAVFQIGERMIYPFGIECAVMQHPMVHRCAVVQHNDRHLLCLEGDGDLEAKEQDFSEYDYLEFTQVNQIPMDRRHNAKIDYPALHSMLDETPTK